MSGKSLVTQTPLGQMLLQQRLISPDQLNAALLEQEQTNKRLGEILIRHRLLSFDQLDRLLEEQLAAKQQRQR